MHACVILTFLDAPLDKLFELLEVGPVILRAVGGGSVEWIADLHLLDFLHDPIDEHVVNRILDEQATRRDAILTLEEGGKGKKGGKPGSQVVI